MTYNQIYKIVTFEQTINYKKIIIFVQKNLIIVSNAKPKF